VFVQSLVGKKYANIIDIFIGHKQIGIVDKYAHKFEELMHKILLHNHSYDEIFIVTFFLAGIRPYIHREIKLQNPGTIHLAFSCP
jgi:hypothetical protein